MIVQDSVDDIHCYYDMNYSNIGVFYVALFAPSPLQLPPPRRIKKNLNPCSIVFNFTILDDSIMDTTSNAFT